MAGAADVPVLLIAFNRPEKTAQVFEAVRSHAPRRLYLAADGPRPDHPDDAERCARTRQVLDGVDWPCEVRTLYRERNLGCRLGVGGALDWFLDEVGEGIILEDDCVPTPDFFPFCAELLERYRDTPEVMMVSGHNSLGAWGRDGPSYVFSRTTPIWGWATWRRAWALYDPALAAWADPAARELVRARMPRTEYRITTRRFDSVYTGQRDTWDYGWAFSMLANGAYSVIPARNLIVNIGFDQEATHTRRPSPHEVDVPTHRLDFPLAHPAAVRPDPDFEQALYRHRFPLLRRLATTLSPRMQARIVQVAAQVGARLRRPATGGPAPP